jgi:hypothetical protein
VEEPDELLLLWLEAGAPRHRKLRVDLPIATGAPLELPLARVDPKRGAAGLEAGVRQLEQIRQYLYQQLASLGEEPSSAFLFWHAFERAPWSIPRESAKVALGDHPKWKEILAHVYTPCEDLLLLLDPGGAAPIRRLARDVARLVPPPRASKLW